MQRENKSDEWVKLVLRRFRAQLPFESTRSQKNHESTEHIKNCIISLSEHNFSMVVAELAGFIKEPSKLVRLSLLSLVAVTLEQFSIDCCKTKTKVVKTNPERCAALPDEVLNKRLLPAICAFITQSYGFPLEAEQKILAGKVLSHISVHHFSALFNRIAIRLHVLANTEDNSDTGELELIRHLHVNVSSLKILLQESNQVFRSLKKIGQLALVSGLEKAIWNWVENSPDEFAQLQREPSPELSEYAEKLFDMVDNFAESSKRKAAVWPLQIMLLILCPDMLEQIATSEKVFDVSKANKKEFLDHLKKALNSTKHLTESAAVVCVKLCKVATYMKPEDNSVLCFLVVSMLNELKALLFNVSKPFSVGSGGFFTTEELMVDCFVSSFRINYRNNQHFDICLQPNSPIIFHLVYVKGTYAIVKEAPLRWWPKAEVLHPKASALRHIFLNICNKVQNGEQEGQQSRLSQIYKVKDKKHKEDEVHSNKKQDKELLLWLVKIFHADPVFAFNNPDLHGWEIQKNSTQVIMGVVNLMLTPSLPAEIRNEAAETLLCFFEADHIEMWNPVAPIASFWEISSQVMVSIAEFLIGHGSHGTVLLRYLRDLTMCKIEFLRKHQEQASIGCHLPICTVSQTKLEEVFLSYLWNPDMETVLISLSCFGQMCNEVDIVQSSETLNVLQTSQNLNVYNELSQEATKFRAGRAALQKRIMALLRQLDSQTAGNFQAWESTYTKWQKLTFDLVNFGKDDSPSIDVQKYLRRRSHAKITTDNLQTSFIEWTFMTGFLCSLGGVCLTSLQPIRRYSRSLPSSVHSKAESTDTECATVTKFMQDVLSLLVCSNDKTGLQIRSTVNELVGVELSPKLYPILLTQIMTVVNSFFTPSGQVVVQEKHTLFIAQIIVIIKHILENKLGHKDCFQMSGIDAMILSFVRYVRNLPVSHQALQIKCKLCQLIDVIMAKRDELLLHQEVKLRNKLVEYLTDWVLPSAEHHQSIPLELSGLSKDLDATVMRAIASLLSGLPLQPEGMETDIMEAKSQLFLKYFTLFMNLMNGEKGTKTTDEQEEKGEMHHNASQTLHQNAVLAMSNLLNANIDTGLMYAIGLGYHDDLQTRAVFMEVLTKILQQGTEFDNLADTVLMDRFDRLVDLLTLTGEKGKLPIVMALANVVPSQQMDELAHVLVTLFDDRKNLPQLLNNVFSMEVLFGGSYLHTLLAPLIAPMYKEHVSFEVDPTRLEKGQNVEENRNNLIKAAQKFINEIVISAESFPIQLRRLCNSLREIVHQRFPKHSLEAVGSAFFLRFINPAISTSALGDQITDELLIYHALITLESCIERPWELVVDFTHTTLENRFSPSTVLKLLTVVPDGAVKNLQATYLYNCSSSLRQYAKYNERHLSPLKGRSIVRVCESLSKLHEYISSSELKLPSSTVSLEEDLKVFHAFRVSSRSNVLVKVGPTSVQITTPERHRVLGYSSILNDVYYASEVKGATVEDENLCLLKLANVGPGILLMSNDSEQIVQAVTHVKTRWQLSQPDSSTTTSKKIKPKDVPGTLLNMALLNLGTSDPSLRLAAYNLLCSVTKSFNLKIEERLLEGTGLCIPANNTLFIVGISEKLAAREPQLTLEFLEECIAGFVKSDYELKHLCLEYMAPWLPNLARFCRFPADDPQKVKMTRILEELINLTVKEKGVSSVTVLEILYLRNVSFTSSVRESVQ
ncbi:hypothetical protein pdam_00008370 [Pocillopora damicornis]|uniref:Ras-GAP domain-containing protein n=1 Tax=Pocillopora damicornis TaxID=46731 RepID=A0A3M6TB27_POCDA|nr:hypothetical protein pdam_00008370 [Pocillopora damicornis]